MADIREMIRRKAAAAGIDPRHAETIASIETGNTFNPTLTSPTGHKGLFQFGPSEWKTYGGGGDINDPEANTDAFVRYHKDIQQQMKDDLGRDPTPQELYLGWQQGAKGAADLIKNPDKKASDIVPAANLTANGIDPSWTSAQVVNTWGNNYLQHQNAVSGLPPMQYVASVPEPAMQQPDKPPDAVPPPPAAPSPVPGLLAQSVAMQKRQMQNQQDAGLLAAGAPTAVPAPQWASLLSPYKPQAIPLPNLTQQQSGLLGTG